LVLKCSKFLSSVQWYSREEMVIENFDIETFVMLLETSEIWDVPYDML
jgi:hypothetical protein